MLRRRTRTFLVRAVALVVTCIAADIGAARDFQPVGTGTIVLVGGVLAFNETLLWQRIVELAGGESVDIVVIGTAHERGSAYAEFARRALARHAPFTEVLPIESEPVDSDLPDSSSARSEALAKSIADADAAFFVGGSSARLSRSLFKDGGANAPIADAVRDLFARGAVVAGGIPEMVGVDGAIPGNEALRAGRLPVDRFYPGLGLLPSGWYVDQYVFAPGGLARTLVAMRQLGIRYGIGVDFGTAAIIRGTRLEVMGKGAVLVLDLARSDHDSTAAGFGLHDARISWIESGDVMYLDNLEVGPHASRLDGFGIDRGAGKGSDRRPINEISLDLTATDALRVILFESLSGVRAAGSLGDPDDKDPCAGREFRFVFQTGPETQGWILPESGIPRFTAHRVRLDVVASEGGKDLGCAGKRE